MNHHLFLLVVVTGKCHSYEEGFVKHGQCDCRQERVQRLISIPEQKLESWRVGELMSTEVGELMSTTHDEETQQNRKAYFKIMSNSDF